MSVTKGCELKVGSQNYMILHFMQTHDRITPLDALNICGSLRLAARIKDLKKVGYKIESERITVKCAHGGERSVAAYRLVGGLNG